MIVDQSLHTEKELGDYTQNISLQKVLYLPELDKNLLSVNAMVRRGATVTFKDDKCEISIPQFTCETAAQRQP